MQIERARCANESIRNERLFSSFFKTLIQFVYRFTERPQSVHCAEESIDGQGRSIRRIAAVVSGENRDTLRADVPRPGLNQFRLVLILFFKNTMTQVLCGFYFGHVSPLVG